MGYKELFEDNGRLRKMTDVMVALGITRQNIISVVRANFKTVEFEKIATCRKPYFEADLTVEQVLFIAMSLSSSSDQGHKVKTWLSENFNE